MIINAKLLIIHGAREDSAVALGERLKDYCLLLLLLLLVVVVVSLLLVVVVVVAVIVILLLLGVACLSGRKRFSGGAKGFREASVLTPQKKRKENNPP